MRDETDLRVASSTGNVVARRSSRTGSGIPTQPSAAGAAPASSGGRRVPPGSCCCPAPARDGAEQHVNRWAKRSVTGP
eukprot:CAMPEP_0171140602 /NCGR_PEP_ID=MMETSP0766_2-20121228/139045_1 /TAXON_ID=439317 /ORGANISM="Gambierdiscus australes, Strain CAWD 149" /LENGTH=77 /DNA_ID=CAMNT_0011604303 /DNA_START=495 /DNA_END=725 /DNA_ORIENTATION=+